MYDKDSHLKTYSIDLFHSKYLFSNSSHLYKQDQCFMAVDI